MKNNPIKRNNWKNSEIIEICRGLKVESQSDSYVTQQILKSFNQGIDTVEQMFSDFGRKTSDYSAKGYDTNTKMIFAIGPKFPQ